MKNLYVILVLMVFLSGCATKMAYLNTQKPPEEVKKDKSDCQVVVDAADLKDSDLKQKKFNQCMKDKGYNVVSKKQAQKIQGFDQLWIKPGTDLKPYEIIFIEKVDLAQVKEKNNSIPNTKVKDDDINKLGDEMLRRFSDALGGVMQVVTAKEEMAGRRALYLRLKLINISETNIGINTALKVAGHYAPVPLPGAPEGAFSFEGIISASFDREELMIISDQVKADKNSSLAGFENFAHWQKAYNVMDYWADHLATLLAKECGRKYKSRLGIKLF